HAACYQAQEGGYVLGTPFGQCGGFYPVFANTDWRWALTFDSDAGPLPVYKPSITIQGSAVTFDDVNDWFQAGSANGTAEVAIASRLYSEAIPVKVISPAEVVSGEARLVMLSDGVEQAIVEL